MMSEHRIELCAPSEWDVVLSPELAPLFVLEAAILAAQRFFSIRVDPSSGGTAYPPTRALLKAMRRLRCHVRQYRAAEQAFADTYGEPRHGNDDDIPEHETHDDGLF